LQTSTLEPKKAIRALLIEDNPTDADLLQETLQHKSVPKVEVQWVERLEDGFRCLDEQKFDVILLDLSLPDSSTSETLRKTLAKVPNIPIIIFTGLSDNGAGLEAVKNGAQDYLVKGQPNGESIYRAMLYAIERKRLEQLVCLSAAEAKESGVNAHEAQANLAIALHASETGVWLWNFKNNNHEWDRQASSILGVQGATHKEFLQLIHPDDKRSVGDTLDACRRDKLDYNIEYRVVWPDGSIHWVASRGKTFFDDAGNASRMTGICRETTKNKQQEEAAKRLALLEQRDEFVALLAHDLKTPIIGSNRILELMRIGKLGSVSTEQAEFLSQICSSNQSLLLMIANVMDSYRLEECPEPFNCREMKLDSLISSCVSEIASIAQDTGIKVIVSNQPMNAVYADQLAMRRVICNLLSNAMKFTPAGGTVEISAFDRNGRATLAVKDSGVGIEPDQLETVFDRFFQGKTKYRANGLGLGLYLCRRLVNGQSGKISCQSELGQGTTFEVTLPYAPATPFNVLAVETERSRLALAANA
jgi:PAS domain S-box-containing protein